MKNENIDKHISWYSQQKPLYKMLTEKIRDIIKEVLDSEKINYSNIECREKSIESFRNKLEGDIKFKPQDMQDLAGIRIICYVNSDVNKITQTIKNLFNIDKIRSVDKSTVLGTDKVGYRSVHFVAKLPKERIKLPECKKFKELYFEIQIRTILQHAWAEIEHDRNYKFSGILPEDIQRRFSLLAGNLEVVDNEFDNISKLIEEYSKTVSKKTESGNLDILINSTSLRQYLTDKFGDTPIIKPIFGSRDDISKILISELENMGIKTLKQLDEIIPSKIKKFSIEYKKRGSNFAGIIRNILIIHDVDAYFKKAWNRNWTLMDTISINRYKEFGINIESYLKKYNITTVTE